MLCVSLIFSPSVDFLLIFSEVVRQELEQLLSQRLTSAAITVQSSIRGWICRRRWPNLKRSLEMQRKARLQNRTNNRYTRTHTHTHTHIHTYTHTHTPTHTHTHTLIYLSMFLPIYLPTVPTIRRALRKKRKLYDRARKSNSKAYWFAFRKHRRSLDR